MPRLQHIKDWWSAYCNLEQKIPLRPTAVIGTTMLIVSMLIFRSFAEYIPFLSFMITLGTTAVSVVVGLGFFAEIFSSKTFSKNLTEENKLCRWVGRSGLAFLIIAIFCLITDADGNKITNYTEIAYGLNPFVQNTNQNSDPINMRNLIDGCIVDWSKRGRKIDYSELPLDSDGDGCFDEVEAPAGSVNNPNFVPANITTQHSDPYNAYINGLVGPKNTWEIRLYGSASIQQSQNLLEFVWDRFIYSNGRSTGTYELTISIDGTHEGKIEHADFPFTCIDNTDKITRNVKCTTPLAIVDDIKNFVLKYDRASATWQVTVGNPRLFESGEYHNSFNISLRS